VEHRDDFLADTTNTGYGVSTEKPATRVVEHVQKLNTEEQQGLKKGIDRNSTIAGRNWNLTQLKRVMKRQSYISAGNNVMNIKQTDVESSVPITAKRANIEVAYNFLKWFHQCHSIVIQMMSPYSNCLEEDTNEILWSFCAEVYILLLDS